jgi:hypothetical protein
MPGGSLRGIQLVGAVYVRTDGSEVPAAALTNSQQYAITLEVRDE